MNTYTVTVELTVRANTATHAVMNCVSALDYLLEVEEDNSGDDDAMITAAYITGDDYDTQATIAPTTDERTPDART